ncbi:hypothetical protein QHH11_23500 [Aphanizomenon sp. PH219]|nr:hypothetical protein [Aphanizomenon sp. PH219]
MMGTGNWQLDISKKDARDILWNVSTRVSDQASLISGDVYWESILFTSLIIMSMSKDNLSNLV